jgi:predicted phage terminase large subunit-like protein
MADEDEEIRFPLSSKIIHRKKGDILWPAREDDKQLNSQKVLMGDYAFSGQYQQQPVPPGGVMFKTEWITQRFDAIPPNATRILSVDAAFNDSQDSSYVVIQTWARLGQDNYLEDQIRVKIGFHETIDAIRAAKQRRPGIIAVLIEDKANGEAIIQTLKVEFPGVIPVNPMASKQARAASVTPLWSTGRVWLPKDRPWLQEFLHEISSFPGSRYNDQVDAMSQALTWLEETFGLRAFLQQQKRKPFKSHFIFRPGMRVR